MRIRSHFREKFSSTPQSAQHNKITKYETRKMHAKPWREQRKRGLWGNDGNFSHLSHLVAVTAVAVQAFDGPHSVAAAHRHKDSSDVMQISARVCDLKKKNLKKKVLASLRCREGHHVPPRRATRSSAASIWRITTLWFWNNRFKYATLLSALVLPCNIFLFPRCFWLHNGARSWCSASPLLMCCNAFYCV